MENAYNSKTLTIISIVILLYSIDGESFNGSIELLGSTLTFSKPVYVEYATVFAMCFLLWRHLVSTLPTLNGFRAAVINKTNLNNLVGYYKSQLEESLLERIKDIQAKKSPFENQQGRLSDVKVCLLHANILSFDVVVSYKFDADVQAKEFHVNTTSDIKLYTSIQWKYAKCFLATIFKEPQFWETYYPIVLSVSALIVYIYNLIQR
ncbi:hypothetical protein CVS42_11165 [Aeromonas veronii]|uniref:hypothetical protein n=1 Tax=Aeromonas veronii TaxID=654 RepID=UPI000C2943AD|nr:hypothetical protein [Aeromonas veronii]ATY81333.1 hypothetical protein CVS42_11165 [Aeromonas veronii]